MTKYGSTSQANKKRHLTQLPVKTFKVAPGDVVGGLIYVMDKPLGIEEGMVGISIDSPGYRNFAYQQIRILDKNRLSFAHVNEQTKAIQQQYNRLVKFHSFESLSAHEKEMVLDLFLHHPNIQGYLASLNRDERKTIEAFAQANFNSFDNEPLHKKIPVPFFSNVKKIFSKKMHEIRAADYVNEGMGGQLFSLYKAHCHIEEKDHFATKINKLIHEGHQDRSLNTVYMVKQDGKLGPFNGTGPGIRKILKTTTGQKLQSNFMPPRVFFILPPLYAALQIGIRRLVYLIKNKPTSVNADAMTETLATKLAQIKGCKTQDIETIKGTYENGSPKIVTMVSWTPGCHDLTGRVTSDKKMKGLIVAQTAKGETLKTDNQGNIYYRKEIKKEGKVVGYEYFMNTDLTPIKKGDKRYLQMEKAYKEAYAVSEDRIDGLGESLTTFIGFADHDGLGKKGQNKAIIPGEMGRFTFYGIDFGKAYTKTVNPVIHTLSDDFTFEQPSSFFQDIRFNNYSILYDNPLRNKMKGIYYLAALKGVLKNPEKENIAKEYQNEDPAFASKLREISCDSPEKSPDILLIDAEIAKYKQEALREPDKAEEYQIYFERLQEIRLNAITTDNQILSIFAKRLKLLPSQIDMLEKLEKISAKSVDGMKENKEDKVLRNHLRVKRKNRLAWQFEDGQLTSSHVKKEDLKPLQERFNKMRDSLKQQLALMEDGPNAHELSDLIARLDINFTEGVNKIPRLSQRQLALFNQFFSEESIANIHQVPHFMTTSARKAFSDKRDALNKLRSEQGVKQKLDAKEMKAHPSAEKASLLGHQRSEKATKDIRKSYSIDEHARKQPIGPTQEMAQQQDTSLSQIDNYLNQERPRKYQLHHIKEITPANTQRYAQYDARIFTFENPADIKQKSTVYATQKGENLVFSTSKSASPEEFKMAAREACRLILFSARSGTHITLPDTLSEEKQHIVKEVFDNAVSEAINAHIFSEKTKPTLSLSKSEEQHLENRPMN